MRDFFGRFVLSGVNVKIVQVVMRHSTIKLTLDTYGHLLPGQEAEAVHGLGRFFDEPEPCARLVPTRQLRTFWDATAQGRAVGGAVQIARNTQKTRAGRADKRRTLPARAIRRTCCGVLICVPAAWRKRAICN